MRVLVVTNPGLGHLTPMLPVIRALQAAGHEILLATAATFARQIREMATVAAGLDWQEAYAEHLFPEMSDLALQDRGDWLLSNVFADEAAHAMLADLVELCRKWQPHVLLRNDYEFASPVASEYLDLPLATVSVSLMWTPTALEQRIGAQLSYLRSAYGLAPYPSTEMLYRGAYFSYAPRSYQTAHLPGLHSIRIPTETAATRPDWLDDMSGRPLIYASMGTVFSRESNIFPDLLQGLRDEDINLVLTVGRRNDPAAYGPQPDNVRIEQFIPQEVMLSVCDVFVTHSPFYTQLSAVARGVPLLMIPLTGDQQAHGARGAALGIGQLLRLPADRSRFLPPETPVANPTAIRNAVLALLEQPEYRTRVGQMQSEIAALPPVASSVYVLEELGTPQPE